MTQNRQLREEPLLLQTAESPPETKHSDPQLFSTLVPGSEHQCDLQDRGGMRGAVQGEAKLRPGYFLCLPRYYSLHAEIQNKMLNLSMLNEEQFDS